MPEPGEGAVLDASKADPNMLSVETGEFQAMMQVALVNDGPVTLWIDTGCQP